MSIYLPRATLKFDVWPWKTIWRLFYTTSSFVHNFVATNELIREFDGWPGKQKGTTSTPLQTWCIISSLSAIQNWSYSPKTINSGQNSRYFYRCGIEIWRMTLKNNRAYVLHRFKLCASLHSHPWIQTGALVRKPSNRGELWMLHHS